jgi:glycosyltransferase involved in cell wall biosynthesis
VSALAAATPAAEPALASALCVAGVLDPRSLGVSRYAARLAEALAPLGVSYSLSARAPRVGVVHFHLANSSRALLRERGRREQPVLCTVHDVTPRTRALVPAYRVLAYPRLARAACVVCHSAFAADRLVEMCGRRPGRLEVIPHPATAMRGERAQARRALGWPEDALIAVLPGAIRQVKLVSEALAAVSASPGWRLCLAGRALERGLVSAARARGTLVLEDLDDAAYARALLAADCVLCLRRDSVGETNGPLLDALGAGRAVLATRTGSIPEVAGECVAYCEPRPSAIAASLGELSDPGTRRELERAARARAGELTWHASAEAHAALFREVARA